MKHPKENLKKMKMPTKLEELFSRNMKKYRETLGLTQEKLAELAGVEAQHISRLERALNAPKLDTLVNLAKALNVSVESLLGLKTIQVNNTQLDQFQKIIEQASEHQRKVIINTAKAIITTK